MYAQPTSLNDAERIFGAMALLSSSETSVARHGSVGGTSQMGDLGGGLVVVGASTRTPFCHTRISRQRCFPSSWPLLK